MLFQDYTIVTNLHKTSLHCDPESALPFNFFYVPLSLFFAPTRETKPNFAPKLSSEIVSVNKSTFEISRNCYRCENYHGSVCKPGAKFSVFFGFFFFDELGIDPLIS